jgi:hypothetical protein
MTHESKILIVDNLEADYSRIIAQIDLSSMGNAFPVRTLFESCFTSKVYVEDGHHGTDVDRYGDNIRYTKDIDKLITYFTNSYNRNGCYRERMLLGLLKTLDANDFKDLQILHYGY